MRDRPPSRAAVAESKELLRALSGALQTYRLYPEGHPNRSEAHLALLEPVRRLVDASDGAPVLFVTRHSFYLGPALLSRESLSMHRLVEAFEEAEVEAVEFLPQADGEALDRMVRVLAGQIPVVEHLGGITLNRVRPMLDSVDESVEELSEMLQSYAIGLDVLRDTAARVAAGETADLHSVRRVVERLAAQVAGDPAQALLLTAVKSYDEYTYYHMLNVAILALALGHAIGLRQDQVATLGVGALLHDVGKAKVPVEILRQVGALSEEQWRLIQRHPVDGAGLILMTAPDMFDPAVTVVLEHHAAYDLSGYPSLSSRPHPGLPARLVSVADCFDAVTSTRSYRAAEERRQALSILQAGAGRGFDPTIVRTFIRMLGVFPVGSLVQVTGGAVGIVVRNPERLLARPTVRLVLDQTGTPCNPDELDLSTRRADGSFVWSVERSMDPAEIGVDIVSLVVSGEVEPAPDGGEGGLVHEPSPGEPSPEGYVDAHPDGGARELFPEAGLRVDPEVNAPFPA